MTPFDNLDWSASDGNEQLNLVRKASNTDMRVLARHYDWASHPETVLGWMMAQKSMDLSSALVVFFNGDPERFNYLAKRDVPQEYRGAARVLDNICLRVNSGFYRVRPGQKLRVRARLEKWLEYQQADRDEGRRGRWILDEAIIAGALNGAAKRRTDEKMPDMDAIRQPANAGIVQGLMAGLKQGRLVERLQRFLPQR